MGSPRGLPPLWGLLSQRGLLTPPIPAAALVTASAVAYNPTEQQDLQEEAQYLSAGPEVVAAALAWLPPPCAVQRC